jgi:integrase/recombinase XerD
MANKAVSSFCLQIFRDMLNVIITTSLFHDTRRAKQNGKCPVKLCINSGHKAKYYATGIDMTVCDFNKLNAKRTIQEITDIKNELHSLEARAKAIIQSLKPFSFITFERKLSQKPIEGDFFEVTFKRQIAKLKKEKRIGTAVSYECCFHSLISFRSNLSFEAITADFLIEYENWMIGKGKSKTTVGIYLRALRAIFNEAIAEGNISQDIYPFGKKKYQIPAGRNIKKALSLSDIGKIYYYELETMHEGEARAKDFWLFSYFANGMNIKDIALLKGKNIQGDYIVFERAKTLRSTRSNPKPISIYITDDMRKIIQKWGNAPLSPDTYLFPIINLDADAVRQRLQIQQFIKVINTWMKYIAEKTGIEKSVTTYAARHSFSTVLKRSGASVEFISEALGHTDVKTTESYLDSFENDIKRTFAEKLTAFKIDVH